MPDNVKKFHQMEALAQDVLLLARNTLLVHLRFLDMALNQFTPASYPGTLATDGQHLFYDAYYVLSAYKAERERSVRDYLHIVLHCVFRHLFISPDIDRRCWDLACDIAVESAINDLGLDCAACRRQTAQQEILRDLERQVTPLTAEKLYRHLVDRKLRDDQLSQLREPFLADDHRAWYLPVKGGTQGGGGEQSGTPAEMPNSSAAKEKEGQGGSPARQSSPSSASEARRKQLEETWKEISQRLQVDLDTLSARQSTGAKGLIQELKAVNRETYDYGEFLRRYMTLGETVQINDDEFDYIFYTYGLKLYENMPLVEPLEYKEVRRVKEFVIAIDTSGSVSGDLVQRFITKTYNILEQQENFFTKINLHIIQCDAEVQEDRRITCRKDFETYLKTMKLRGFGGTDFRPVFRYVDDLILAGEFTNLKGMIYFTDGQGVFPDHPPAYDAAFVFVNDDYVSPDVPVWAIKLVLQREEL